jgi:rubrerythrin
VNELQRKMESVENAFQQHRLLVDKINDEQDSKLDELADKVHLQFQKNQEKINALHGTVMNTQRKPIEDLPRLNDNDGAVKMMRIELEAQNRANEREVAKLRQALDTLQTNLADSIHHLIDQIAEVKDSALSQYGVARKQDDNTLRLLRVSLEDSIKNNEREFAKMKNDFNVMADSFIKLKQSSIASTQPEAKEVPSAKLRAVVGDDTATLKAAIKDLQENQDHICDDLDGIEKNIKSMQDTLVDLVLKSKQ